MSDLMAPSGGESIVLYRIQPGFKEIGTFIRLIKNSLTKKTLKNQGNTEKMIL
jgi:hypothetical protein